MEDNSKLKTNRKNEMFVFDQITGELEILEIEFDYPGWEKLKEAKDGLKGIEKEVGVGTLQSDATVKTGDEKVSIVVFPAANE
ncbi:MAG TPA: hypothetical protein VNN20_08870 [Thermodesulfobacteriota bacterium]|nr:hypothetical protein [Thermodesulfobacteriota bacterium]